MPTKTDTGIDVMVGSDPYALTQDTLKLAKSIDVVVRITTPAERAALRPVAGRVIVRLDLPGTPLELYNGTAWVQLTGLRHVEYTGPAFTTVAGTGMSFGGPGSGAAFAPDTAVAFNNSFVQPDVPGRVKILQTGTYTLVGMILPTSVPSNYSLRITDITMGRPLASRGGVGYGDRDQSIDAVGAYLVAGTVVEFGVTAGTAITLGSRIKITKVQ